jgi:MinD superfamily P-loop ATPase
MKLAIASGKGGTGKTTISTNLAWYLSQNGHSITYFDCDVEEPNGHLFLKPKIIDTIDCTIPIPLIDTAKCIACGECVRFCQYKALARIGKEVLIIEDLCHGCGGCMLVCPHKAISEKQNIIGKIEKGFSEKVGFVHGILNVGKAMSPPLIRQVLSYTDKDIINIIDSPPGTSCPVIASIKNVDYVLLVTEPTPFGLNDLGLALDMVKAIGIPHSVVVNRADPQIETAKEFCKSRGVEIIAEIPEERKIAEVCSKGELFCEKLPEYKLIFENLWANILERTLV